MDPKAPPPLPPHGRIEVPIVVRVAKISRWRRTVTLVASTHKDSTVPDVLSEGDTLSIDIQVRLPG